jgi:uncharacterized membrane protein SpoIIM required for sporulation
MKQLLDDAFGLIKSYKNVYLITALIFVMGIILGMLGLIYGPFPMNMLINDILGAGSGGFWETLGDSVKIALLMLIFGVIVFIPLLMTLFQGTILGMTILLLPGWTDGWTAGVYIVLTGILFYPAIIFAGGNGALIGLKVIRQLKETTWSELIQGTVTLTIVLVLPVLLMSAGLKTGIASGVMDRFLSGQSAVINTADLDSAMRDNGYFYAGKSEQPADFLLIRTAFYTGGVYPVIIPSARGFTNGSGGLIGVCYSDDTRLKPQFPSNNVSVSQHLILYHNQGNPPLIEIVFLETSGRMMDIFTDLSNRGYRVLGFN